MNTILNPAILLPIGIIILQAIVLLSIAFFLLGRLKLIKQPLQGMEYSHTIILSTILLGVLIIFLSAVSPTFQAFKSFQNQQISIFQPLLSKSGQFFIIILFFEILFAFIIYLTLKLFFRNFKISEEIGTNNIPLALFIGAIIIGFAITLNSMAREIIEFLIPHYLTFQ